MECVQQSIVEKPKKSEEEASQLFKIIQTEMEQRGALEPFVQTFTTVKPAPLLNDWTIKTIRTPSYKASGATAVSELRKDLNIEMETLFKGKMESCS
uniref:Uncharacterized protein n=1 Tax=Knipowitschia caucasica TaxID=637954 RepID=A0AAV2JIQ9_KNICA